MVPIIPAPTRLDALDGEPFALSATTSIIAPPELAGPVAWFRAELAAATGLALEPGDGGDRPAIRIELAPADSTLAGLPATGGVRADDGDAQGERYGLEVRADGAAIRAATPEGVFRALATLLQLAATTPAGDGEIPIPAASILDTPRFAWRGLTLDVVRNAYTVDEVKRVIDLIALYKANVLHLHLTDSEGWRLEIDAWPNLAEVGGKTAAAGRPGLCYTKEQFRDLVRYAADRFITVVPEFEMPGHTAAIFAAYPELAGDGAHPDASNLDKGTWFQAMHPDNPRIFPFIQDVLSEIAELTPGGYLHVGGDEALGMDAETYERFMRQAAPIVDGAGKKLVAWQEMARAGFRPGDICQLWISPRQGQDRPEIDPADIPADLERPENPEEILAAFAEFLKLAHLDLGKALEQGATILVSQSSNNYLDTKYREESSDPAQAADHKRLGMPFYPKTTVAEFYAWDPATIQAELAEDRVAGVEAAIWCETVRSLDDLFFLVLPRLPGVLEKGWSPSGGTWDAYAPRLAAQASLWERRGWPYFRSSVVWPA